MFKRIFLSILFLSFSTSYLYADKFFPSGDSDLNRYYDALGYSINSTPENKECAGCIEYELQDIEGKSTQEIFDTVPMDDITYPDPGNNGYGYGLVRRADLISRVALPPQSRVDFIYWGENTDSQEVYIPKIEMFLSRYNPAQGNLLKLLNMSASYKQIDLKYMVWNYPRSGYVKAYDGLGIVSGNTILNPFVLDTAEVKTPLEFVKWSANIDSPFAKISLTIKNKSEYELKDITFRHNEFTQKKTFLAGEEYIFEYTIAYDSSNSLGYSSLLDPNFHQECIAYGTSLQSYVVEESLVVSAQRSSGEMVANVVGSRVKPTEETFCIIQIPYTIYSQEMILDIGQNETVESLESVVKEGEIGEILGIKKLPQTNRLPTGNILTLLVAVSLLWYYLRRRF